MRDCDCILAQEWARLRQHWMAYYGDTLRHRYGAGTAIEIFEAAVVDFGGTAAEVRSRVESELGEPLFVAAIPETSPVVKCQYLPDKRSAYRRRVLFTVDKWHAGGEYLGGNELLDGIIWDDCQERRHADHNYRLLLKHGTVSHEPFWLAGSFFGRKDEHLMTDGPLNVPLEDVGTIIARIFERGADRIIIDRDHDSYVVLVDGIGCSDPDEFATALWYIDAMHAIATADRSWPAGNDPRLPHNPKRKVL